MGSNYVSRFEADEVHETSSEEGLEVPCKRCYGSGIVYVHDQETDCIDCEGMGSVIV